MPFSAVPRPRRAPPIVTRHWPATPTRCGNNATAPRNRHRPRIEHGSNTDDLDAAVSAPSALGWSIFGLIPTYPLFLPRLKWWGLRQSVDTDWLVSQPATRENGDGSDHQHAQEPRVGQYVAIDVESAVEAREQPGRIEPLVSLHSQAREPTWMRQRQYSHGHRCLWSTLGL